MITYLTLAKDDIGRIRPLWEALNRHHLERSTDFKEHFRTNTFERRIEKLHALPEDRVYIETAQESGTLVGYVVASVSDSGAGEINSIFIDGKYRTRGVGRDLMEGALEWLSGSGCSAIIAEVAEGNEETFGFYRRFGFCPRMTTLVRDGR